MKESSSIGTLLSVSGAVIMAVSIICALVAFFNIMSSDFDEAVSFAYIAIPLFVSSAIMMGLGIITNAAFLYISKNEQKDSEIKSEKCE